MQTNRTHSVGHVVTALFCVIVFCSSCQSEGQGYWTKHGVSQALTNQQYPADSEQCERFAVRDEGRNSEPARSTRYTKCMYARGYEWVDERPVSHPVTAGGSSSTQIDSCSSGRKIVDAFGYPKCVPSGTKSRGPDKEISATIKADTPRPTDNTLSTQPAMPTRSDRSGDSRNQASGNSERWALDDKLCRRQANDTLSSPYGIYAQCMREKGWPAAP